MLSAIVSWRLYMLVQCLSLEETVATMVGVGPLSRRRLNSSRLRRAEIQKIECPMSVHDTNQDSVGPGMQNLPATQAIAITGIFSTICWG